MANGQMYTSGQIAAGAFFGGPIASTVMMRANFLAMSDVGRAKKTVLYGLIGTLAVLVVAALVPENFPKSVIPVTYTGLFQTFAKQAGMQKGTLISRNIQIRSNWRVAGLSILWILITGIVVLIAIFLFFFAKAVFAHH